MSPKLLATALLLGFANIASGATLRHYLVAHMRIAAADRLIEQPDEIAAYMEARFNTLALYDTEDTSGLPKSEERIAYEVEFARSHGLHILLGKATETDPAAADDAIRERLTLWATYGRDVVLGVFFLHDDACQIHATVERQRHLYALAHDTVPDWYVFGMIGGACADQPDEEVARYFDAAAFDHLIILMYPLNVGAVVPSVDRDTDLRRYVTGYIQQMGERFISRLSAGQLAVIVVQAFAYHEEPIMQVPRAEDIDIQASAGSAALRQIPGQAANASRAYFLWDGSRAGMFGLWQRPDWIAAAEGANRRSEEPAGATRRRP